MPEITAATQAEAAIIGVLGIICDCLTMLGIEPADLERLLADHSAVHLAGGQPAAAAVLETLRAHVADPHRRQVLQAIRQPGSAGSG